MKKIIINLDGVIFEPIDSRFARTAINEYGKIQGRIVTLAYKYGIGRRFLGDKVENVFYKCASRPCVRHGAIEALTHLTQIPDISIEFCTDIASKKYAASLEQQYRTIDPCMNTGRYALITPGQSRRAYIAKSCRDENTSFSYVLESRARNLDWSAKSAINPILVCADRGEVMAARNTSTARVFDNLPNFLDFLSHRR